MHPLLPCLSVVGFFLLAGHKPTCVGVCVSWLTRSVREHQVGDGGLQPVPGDHLADFGRAVVGELEVGAPGAGLKVQIQVPVQHRGAEAPQRHAVEAGARVDVAQVVLELLILRGGGRGGGVGRG